MLYKATLACVTMLLASLFGEPAALGQSYGSESIVYLCNETSMPVLAEYTLFVNGESLFSKQPLEPLQGGYGDTSACYPLRIPNYTGKIIFSGTADGRRFPTTALVAGGGPLYVWYYNEGTQCWRTKTQFKACLELGGTN